MMAQKNATPSREQQASLKKAGLDPLYWVVTREFPSQLIVNQRFTGEWRLIDK